MNCRKLKGKERGEGRERKKGGSDDTWRVITVCSRIQNTLDLFRTSLSVKHNFLMFMETDSIMIYSTAHCIASI